MLYLSILRGDATKTMPAAGMYTCMAIVEDFSHRLYSSEEVLYL